MATAKPNCPKCGHEMERGYIPDYSQGGSKLSTWVKGWPERSFWFGLHIPRERQIPIVTFRCGARGLLESYALKNTGSS